MLNPHDRRDLACLGLLVLVYGLAVAPVLHAAVGHGGGGHEGVSYRHSHAHGPSDEAHSHGLGRDGRPSGWEHEGTGEWAHAWTARQTGTDGNPHARTTRHQGEDGKPHALALSHAGTSGLPYTADPRRVQGSQHRVPADDAPGNGHGPDGHGPDGHKHLTGSVEHLHAVAAAWAAALTPARVPAVSWLADVLHGPSRAPGAAPRPTAMPQGP